MSRSTYRTWAGTLLLFALTLLVYAPSFGNGFVFDDDVMIFSNANVTQPGGLYRTWFTTQQLDYWPLTTTCLWLEWRLFGADATGYHVVSAILHALSALLVWRVLLRLGVPGAWLASALFAVHPVNVGAVAWAARRKDTLPLVFYLLALLTYLDFDAHGNRRRYLATLGLFALALLAKTAAVVLPLVLLACVWWRHGAIRRRDILRSLPLILLSLIFGLITVWFQYHQVIGENLARSDGFISRLVGAGRAVWFYLHQALWPVDLARVYPRWRIDPTRAVEWLPLVALLACFAVSFWFRRRWGRPLWFALTCYTVSLLPILGFLDIIAFQVSLVADYWQYFALPSLIALVTGGGVWLVRRREDLLRIPALGIAALGIGLGVALARAQTSDFRDEETFFRATVASCPTSILPWFLLSDVLGRQGRFEEQQRSFAEGLRAMRARIQAGGVEFHEHLFFATVFQDQGLFDEARTHWNAAIRLRPGTARAHQALGQLCEGQGEWDQAEQQYRLAIQAQPDHAHANLALAQLLRRQGRSEEAIRQLQIVAQLQPYDLSIHGLLGDILAEAGQVEQAARQYRKILEINPTHHFAQQRLRALGDPGGE